ncbi:ABC transporter permease [Propioniciclava tarda]|uniref:ABC transporter permease n=1 Tax=Propioniciclava tarda TaxID=433330 RepID=A0A4Q9KLZ9_PROTD|nr:ABC transporter permease [Propioniciclava tarda]TBT95434.1 ABC transporter permease [Propioniciclava tarda]SMO49394.1 ABC-2 type transport system permease protein [Propioniciclava tarda]
MSIFGTVLAFEARKLLGATVTRVATLASLGLVTITTAGGYAAAQAGPASQLGRKASGLVDAPGWAGYTGLAATSVGITTLLAVGIVMAWTAGREFTDNTIVGLFALPAAPATIACAKIAAAIGWAVALAAAEGVLVAGIGLPLGLSAANAPVAAATVALVGALLGVAALPVMWIATLGRGYLAGISATLALVIVTNIAVGFGLGIAIPWAIPVLWATPNAGIPTVSLLLPVAAALAGATLTAHSWTRLQLGDR